MAAVRGEYLSRLRGALVRGRAGIRGWEGSTGVRAGAAGTRSHHAQGGAAEGLSDRYREIPAGGATCGGKVRLGETEARKRIWDGIGGAPQLFDVCGDGGAGGSEGRAGEYPQGGHGAGCGNDRESDDGKAAV